MKKLPQEDIEDLAEHAKTLTDAQVKEFYRHGTKSLWKEEMIRRGLLKEKK